jgi:hypothetical protein
MDQLFSQLNDAYAKTQNSGVPQPSEYTAGLTPQQISTFQQMIGYGGNQGIPNAQAQTGANYNAMGTGATQGALNSLGSFNAGNSNNMGNTVAGANQYASGLDIPGQVAASMRDATNTANDVTLPGQAQAAAGTGNINSSAVGPGGIAQGLVQRGLATQAGDLSAQLRNSAYNTGAGIAQNQNQTNNAQNLSAYGTMGSLGNAATGLGNDAYNNSINNAGNLFGLAAAGGGGLQGGNQANDTNASQMYAASQNNPYMSLMNYANLNNSQTAANQAQNTNSATQTTSTPSIWQTISGLMGAGGSLAKGLSGFSAGK